MRKKSLSMYMATALSLLGEKRERDFPLQGEKSLQAACSGAWLPAQSVEFNLSLVAVDASGSDGVF